MASSGGGNENEIQVAGTSSYQADEESNWDATSDQDKDMTAGGMTKRRQKMEKEKKLGHRRVGVGGEITYKKIQTSQIMGSIQLGIQQAVGGLASKPERDLLMQDFMTVETTVFNSSGSNHTPAHHYSEFTFKTYAPIAFRYFRDLFGIQPDDFLVSFCSAPLRELSNPGASGSIFYLTQDDEFIMKTVQHKEGEFLQKLLPGYYMNLNQNPRTLLPKFFGLYCYQCNAKNIRLVAMNNLLPSSIKIHLKYDLKGSTYKRKANKTERQKKSPTYKDLDFMEHHPEGLFLEADTYTALVKTIQRDCRVLESFKIMDYSLLVGIHNLDQAIREKEENEKLHWKGYDATLYLTCSISNSGTLLHKRVDFCYRVRKELRAENAAVESSNALTSGADMVETESPNWNSGSESDDRGASSSHHTSLNRSRSMNRQKLVAHSTAMESIQAESDPIDEVENLPPGGIPARNAKGERLLLFIGIIDILQSYRLKKKIEHTVKSLIHDGDTVSVHKPGFYAQRFQEFMAKTVFKKIPSSLKHSPSRRKSFPRPLPRPYDIDLESNNGERVTASPGLSITSPHSQHTTPPVSPPIYPSVLKDRPALPVSMGSPSNIRAPPPVPPRGVRTKRYQGFTKGYIMPSGIPSCSTPPPGFDEAVQDHVIERRAPPSDSSHSTGKRYSSSSVPNTSPSIMSTPPGKSKKSHNHAINVSDVKFEIDSEQQSTLSVGSNSSASVGTSSSVYLSANHKKHMTWTPATSGEGSTPTWTEGTPSFTESSSSGDVGWPSTPIRGVTRDRAASNEIRTREVGQTKIHVEARKLSKEVISNSCNEIETQEVIEITRL